MSWSFRSLHRPALRLGIGCALVAAAAPAAHAGHLVITGVTVTTTVVATGSNTITIRRGGRIETVSASGIESVGWTKVRIYPGSDISVSGSGTLLGVDNEGTLIVENRGRVDVSSDETALGVANIGGPLEVRNWGHIRAAAPKFAAAIGHMGAPTSIYNWGKLEANAQKFAVGVLLVSQSRVKARVWNRGEIEAYAGAPGAGTAFGIGALSAGSIALDVLNTGHIQAAAEKFAAGIIAFSQFGSVRTSVVNTGTIEAVASGTGGGMGGPFGDGAAFGVASVLGVLPFDGGVVPNSGIARVDLVNWGRVRAHGQKFGAGVAVISIPFFDGSMPTTVLNVTNYRQIEGTATGRESSGVGILGIGYDVQARIGNWGSISGRGKKFGAGILIEGATGRAQIFNNGYISGRGKKLGVGIALQGIKGSIQNWGTIQGFGQTFAEGFGVGILYEGLREGDQRLVVENYGVIEGNGAAIQQVGGTLLYRGTIAGLHGPIRGIEGEGIKDTLRVKLYFVPKEAKKELLSRRGVHPGGFSFYQPGVPLIIADYEEFSIEDIISGEEVARSGLDGFGRALDWTRFGMHGPESYFHGGLAQIAATHDWRALNEAFETGSGRAQHQFASDHAFQLTTQRSIDLQRYWDRSRDRRVLGMHGGAMTLGMDPRTSQQFLTSGLDRKLYAEYTGGQIILADVIDEPSEAPPPRRRSEPTPEAAPAPPAAKPEPPAPAGERPLWSAFLSGLGMWADQDPTGNRVDSDWTAAGPTIGIDRDLGNGLAVGFLTGYFRTEGDVDDFGSEFEADSISIGPYATWGSEAGWHASLAAYYTYHQYEQERQITVPMFAVEAESDPDAHQFTSYLSGGYDWRLGDPESPWVVGPYAALQYSLLDIGSYDESGAGPVSLQYDDQSANSLQTHLGLRLTREWRCGWGLVAPEVRGAWVHEFMDDDRSIHSRFNGGAIPPFDVETHVADRDFGVVGASLTLTLERWRQLHFHAGYDARVGQEDYIAHAASAGVSLDF
jgi:uncharacterized protein YhjY with autotransporter beta-barrel domain